jgi:hypothetical protein
MRRDAARSPFRRIGASIAETGAEALTLPGRGDRETSQQHDGHGMTSKPFLETLRRVVIGNLADHKRVIPDNLVIRQGQVGLRSSGLLVLESVADQKTVNSENLQSVKAAVPAASH